MATETLTRPEPDHIAWKAPPTDRRGVGIMALTAVIGTALSTVIGLAIVNWWEGSALGDADADINIWLEEHRTATWDRLAEYGSTSSDTLTKVILGVVLIPVCLWLFRRLHEYFVLVGGLIVEVTIYGISSEVVGRERPPVEQLGGATTASFPSGHIAAATVFYGGLVVIVFMQTRRTWARALAAVVGSTFVAIVIAARLYQGMHYVTDAIGGVAIGVTVLAVMYRVVHRTLPDGDVSEAHDVAHDDSTPGDDLTVAAAASGRAPAPSSSPTDTATTPARPGEREHATSASASTGGAS